MQESTQPSGTVSIVISEVMWMGTDLSTADEWIELAAFSDDSSQGGSATMSGWTLVSVRDGVEQTLYRFGIQAQMAVGEYAVVSNYPESQSRLSISPLAVSTGMSLPNTKLLLRLYDASHGLRDEVDDGVGNPFAGVNTSTQKASMERIDVRAPGNLAANWRTSAISVGFDAVPFALFGSPGSPGSLGISSASPSSSSSMQSSASSVSSFGLTASASSDSSSSSSSSVSLYSGSSSAPPAIFINEVMPNPAGSDDSEWIELMNEGADSASTAGLSVSMSGSTSHPLPSYTIDPGGVLLLTKEITHLTLTNAGGSVFLKQGTGILDSLSYSSVPEGISVGRSADAGIRPLCVPTPGSPNTSSGARVAIDVQSGAPVGTAVTLNLALRTLTGSSIGGTCHWEYPDGYESDSCNPPSHSLNSTGAGEIRLTFTDYCGTTMIQSLPVFVSKKPKKIEEEGTQWAQGFSCMPSAFTGALVTELFPNPAGDEATQEWIEVRNVSGHDLPLCGWVIADASGKRYDLSHFRLPLDEALVFHREQTDITLNNTNEVVRLIAPGSSSGSGEVLQEVSFASAPEGQTLSRREDGVWLWTAIATPGLPNIFPSVALPAEPAKARITSVLPNPQGKDGGAEWFELENLTGRPLWLQGWMAESGGKKVPLNGIAIHPFAKDRINASQLGITLRNATGAVRLFDPSGAELPPLAWDHPKEGALVTTATGAAVSGTVTGVNEDGVLQIVLEDGSERSSTFSYVSVLRINNICMNLYSYLFINKKSELIFSSDGTVRVMVDGYDVALFLLKSGCAYRSHRHDGTTGIAYDFSEREAVDQRRGIWSTESGMIVIRQAQHEEAMLAIVERDGLTLRPSLHSDLVTSGSILSLSSNLPADIFASLNGGPFVPWMSGAVLTLDTNIQAYAEMPIGSGSFVRSDILDKDYVIKRAYYDRQQLLSEVFPSPRKGGEEWIELYNGSPYALHLAGWQIDDVPDGGSRPYTFSSKDTIAAYSYMQVRDLGISWNNGGDAVRLIAPSGQVIDSIVYPKVKAGLSYARSQAGESVGWCLTDRPTLMQDNACHQALKKKDNSRSALIKNKKSYLPKRKIIYENRMQFGYMEPFFLQLLRTGGQGYAVSSKASMNGFGLFVVYICLFFLFAAIRRIEERG